MSNIFGTPVFVYSAEANRDKSQSATSRIEEALKALKPLDKARSNIASALSSLEGTGYEEIKSLLEALSQKITETEQSVVNQLSGGQPAAQQSSQPSQPQASKPNVPTVGQISGAEPIPE